MSLVPGDRFLVKSCFLTSAESLNIDVGRRSRVRRELASRDKTPRASKRYQLADPVTVTGHRERLATLNSVHDLARAQAQITLADLRLR